MQRQDGEEGILSLTHFQKGLRQIGVQHQILLIQHYAFGYVGGAGGKKNDRQIRIDYRGIDVFSIAVVHRFPARLPKLIPGDISILR